jgi:hypothetical protein
MLKHFWRIRYFLYNFLAISVSYIKNSFKNTIADYSLVQNVYMSLF